MNRIQAEIIEGNTHIPACFGISLERCDQMDELIAQKKTEWDKLDPLPSTTILNDILSIAENDKEQVYLAYFAGRTVQQLVAASESPMGLLAAMFGKEL